MPGLVHQFGNLLLTIQGHTLYLDATTLPAAKPTILTACDRGAGGLRILRHLMGETGAPPGDAAEAIGQLAELLRVPVREMGHQLEWEQRGHGQFVDLDALVPLVVAMVRGLVAAVPPGIRGVVALQGVAAGLRVAFRPDADHLPFPLAIDEALRVVRAMLSRNRWQYQLDGHPHGLLLGFPPTNRVAGAQA